MRFYLLTFFVCAVLLINCYTSFKHPTIESASADYYDVRVSDDCMECHQTYPGSFAILPNGAFDDYNWQFYSHIPWWQDVVSVHGGVSDNYLAPTGPRLPNPPPGHNGPVSVPVPGPGSMISKPANVSDDGNSDTENDGRRGFQRRKEATEEPSKRDSKRRAPQQK